MSSSGLSEGMEWKGVGGRAIKCRRVLDVVGDAQDRRNGFFNLLRSVKLYARGDNFLCLDLRDTWDFSNFVGTSSGWRREPIGTKWIF
jgi:hypothetical protein